MQALNDRLASTEQARSSSTLEAEKLQMQLKEVCVLQ